MRKLIMILGVAVLFTACKNNTENTEKTESSSVISDVKEAVAGDGLKSAIYESETVMPGGMGSATNKVIFDDYGKKSRTEIKSVVTFGGKSMNTSANSLMIDGYVYSWQTGAKKGNKFKLDESRFDPSSTDFSKLSEEMKKKLNYKDEGTETVNGKDCKVASFSAEQMTGKVWVWNQIPVKVEMSVVGKTITSNLKSLEENPSIPAGTFDIPADVEFTEMSMPKMPETAQK